MSNDQSQSQEIEEILNEIDNLSEDLKDVGEEEPEAEMVVAEKPQPAPLHVVKAQPAEAPASPVKMSGSALLDAAIEMDAEPQEDLENFEDEDLGDQPMESNSEEGSLTMTLKGNMTLKLNYECAGQSVTVSFSEDALKIQMADGAEFKIPVHKNSQFKAA